jgi:hypothetical protein
MLAALMVATNDRSARLALEAFVSELRRPALFSAAQLYESAYTCTAGRPAIPRRRRKDSMRRARLTRSLGVAFSAPFDALPGFRLENDGSDQAYHSGTYTTP